VLTLILGLVEQLLPQTDANYDLRPIYDYLNAKCNPWALGAINTILIYHRNDQKGKTRELYFAI
jgi:hypothetical protein